MFDTKNLSRTVTAAVGAVLVSFTFIGAAVGPVRSSALTTTQIAAVASDQSLQG